MSAAPLLRNIAPWKAGNEPKDGTVIMAIGRVTWSDEDGDGSSPFTGAIKWDAEASEWCGRRGAVSGGCDPQL